MAPWTLLHTAAMSGALETLSGLGMLSVWSGCFSPFPGVLVPDVFLALLCDVCDVVKKARDVLSSAGSEPVSDSCLHQPTDKALHARVPWEPRMAVWLV